MTQVSAEVPALPPKVEVLVQTLATLPGTVAVALGGSRGAGGAHQSSDWDFAVYYRGDIELSALRAYGEVHPPGAWGRIMNGGAWFRVGDADVDVILRDLDVALHWTREAEAGRFELDALLGYLAGIPTYSLAAEMASGRVLAGELPNVGAMPPKLRETAPPRWRFSRDFSLEYARMHAARGNVVGVIGQAAKAAMEEAHARVCERGRWSLNEKRLLAEAGLESVGERFSHPPTRAAELASWVNAVASSLCAE